MQPSNIKTMSDAHNLASFLHTKSRSRAWLLSKRVSYAGLRMCELLSTVRAEVNVKKMPEEIKLSTLFHLRA